MEAKGICLYKQENAYRGLFQNYHYYYGRFKYDVTTTQRGVGGSQLVDIGTVQNGSGGTM